MEKLNLPESEWRERLTPEQYHVLREAGTERAWTGRYVDNHERGEYRCAGCGAPLFASDAKFESGSGWPSFTRPETPDAVEEHRDVGHGMVRTEVRCARCDGHLGHVFPDGPREDGGLRYCMNSAALDFQGSIETNPDRRPGLEPGSRFSRRHAEAGPRVEPEVTRKGASVR